MRTAAILIARLIFAGAFALAASFKFAAMGMTAQEIAGAGFPAPHLLAWLAAIFEVALILAFLSGAFFTEACLLAIVYVLFLAFSFHGPGRWSGNPMEFGFFVITSPSPPGSCSRRSTAPATRSCSAGASSIATGETDDRQADHLPVVR
jgi:uncharacterized membrane protein YphA (DoxX/SURF4 family)